ncbi:alpha-ketoacid dehydrogenase subunit beta [Natrinema caseinilyticum]|uniref:alpha-ketoacid dehydrogenase subunit beta n=1 Tax=Natrinema caseinilyticum TaxID=2961570 RepID=UPI0020C32404|nr:alpha-ketoacid dehydrogenase subunit beta [Natrinema caseinilyticum]
MDEQSARGAINDALAEELDRDESVYLIGQDIGKPGGSFGITRGLHEEFGGDRVVDTPISEAAIVGSSAGAGLTGSRPVAEIMYADFMGLAADQVMNQAGLFKYMFGGDVSVPMTIRTVNGGSGFNAAAQHSKSLHGLFMHMPGVRVVLATTPYDSKGLLKSAIRSDDPVLFFEHMELYNREGEVPDSSYTLPLGEAAIEREGDDVTVIATQKLVYDALDVAASLEGEISVEVVNPRTVKPLDVETLAESARKTGRVVVADESVIQNGPGAYIAKRIESEAFYHLEAPIEVVGVDDTPIPFSPPLADAVVPDGDDIETAIRSLPRL